jgi:hypothetical protein
MLFSVWFVICKKPFVLLVLEPPDPDAFSLIVATSNANGFEDGAGDWDDPSTEPQIVIRVAANMRVLISYPPSVRARCRLISP